MAAVDSLLSLMRNRGAEALTLRTGQVPVLTRAGEDASLSMPPLEPSMVALFAKEALAERLAAVDAGEVAELAYNSDESFYLRAHKVGEGYSLYFSRAQEDLAKLRGPTPDADADAAAKANDDAAAKANADADAKANADAAAAAPNADAGAGATANADAGSAAKANATACVSKKVARLLERATQISASDIILSTSENARLRTAKGFVEIENSQVTESELWQSVVGALDAEAQETFDLQGSLDLSLTFHGRYRVNVFRRLGGISAAIRPIRSDPPDLESLLLPQSFAELIGYRDGLVLMTGPAGSGKSTTLVALVELANRTVNRHVITIEDPIEYQFSSRRCLIHQREIGSDVDSFASGLRSALRESPDMIMLGEMRDRETIAAALTAAETGHLVLATLHSRGCAAAVDRMIDVFPAHQQQQVRTQLASSLRAVVKQQLLPAASGPRRIPVYEKLVVNDAIAAVIREDKCHQIPSIIQTSRADGMIALDASIADCLRGGLISEQEAEMSATSPEQLRQYMRSRTS